jgi:hypothetical protein
VGRPIMRLEATLAGAPSLHPAGAREVLVARATAPGASAGAHPAGW